MTNLPAAADPITVSAAKATAAPALDGKADDAAWQQAQAVSVAMSSRGNRTRPPWLLGIDRASLWRKIKRYGIEV